MNRMVAMMTDLVRSVHAARTAQLPGRTPAIIVADMRMVFGRN